MKIASVELRNFKRFTHLKIENITADAKLVVLLGPNGCGKSSLFDAFHNESYRHRQLGRHDDADYYSKVPSQRQRSNEINIQFHDATQSDLRKAIYVRTAYRNDPVIDVTSIQKMPSVIQETRFTSMIENDAAATSNYQRLASNALERAFRREDRSKNLGQFQDETLGEIQEAMRRLFPDLVLNSLGNPLSDRSFTFDKGTSKSFLYKNLSGGEKAAFDLLFDIFVKREEYDDTVFCIDEPEAHMNPRLQGGLLEELIQLMNDGSQLWIATHAIGMMRKALQLREKYGEKIVFLDFSDRNFDRQEVITPATPNRRFWEKTHEVALDDLAELVMPDQIVICEGKHGDKGFDAECYNQIFSEEFPKTKFISAGGKGGLRNYIPVVEAVTKGAKALGLRDRDETTNREVVDLQQEGIMVLTRGQIEDYLLADDVLHALCEENEHCDGKVNDLMDLRNNTQDIKNAANKIRQTIVHWGVKSAGETREGFLRDTLAPLVGPGMSTYEELKQIIFGSDTADRHV